MTKLANPAVLIPGLALALLALTLSSAAQTLAGTVTNGTTNKPAAGDEVILINLANGMDVAANTKTDSAGKFSFKLTEAQGPHLIRAVHQGVTYHQIAPPGTNNVEVKVYDVAKKVNGLSLTADVLRFQADPTSLQGIRLFAVNNTSSPPVTQMNEHNFELYLPAGAKVEQVQAKAPNGQPIAADAVAESEKGRYAIAFPLRPGETQFQLEFTMPYSGTLKVDPKPLYPAEHFVVVLPKSMHFAANDQSSFKSMQDPTQADSIVQVATQTHVGQALGFTITGTGTISDQPAQAASGNAGQEQTQAAPDNRPGGGLGAPIDAPDPLEKYRWPIIGAFVLLLAIGGWIVTKRQGAVSVASGPTVSGSAVFGPTPTKSGASEPKALIFRASSPLAAPITGPGAAAISGASTTPAAMAAQAASTSSAHENVATPQAANAPASQGTPLAANATASPASPAASKSAMLLEALKEELFQLEVERKQGKINQADYEKAKAALDQTLERALKRQS